MIEKSSCGRLATAPTTSANCGRLLPQSFTTTRIAQAHGHKGAP